MRRLLLFGACAIVAYYLYRSARELAGLDFGDINDVNFGDEEDL